MRKFVRTRNFVWQNRNEEVFGMLRASEARSITNAVIAAEIQSNREKAEVYVDEYMSRVISRTARQGFTSAEFSICRMPVSWQYVKQVLEESAYWVYKNGNLLRVAW